MRSRARVVSTQFTLFTLFSLASLAGCGVGGGGQDAAGPQEATPQALAAAVEAHTDSRVVAVAPLTEEDGIDGGVGVELALARAEGDNTHLRVWVTDTFDVPEDPCGSSPCRDVSADGTEATLVLETGYPEEDPGVLELYAQRPGGGYLLAYAYGPFVGKQPSAEVEALADTLTALAEDPAVGLRTSAAYAEAGAAICDGGAWLEWYGQGNGYGKPEDYRDWCG